MLRSLFTIPISARPLLVGALYVIGWFLAARFPYWIRHPFWEHARLSPHWRPINRILGLGYTLGVCYLALTCAWIAPLDMGLKPLEWPALASWLPMVIGVISGWAVVLWGSHWLSASPPQGIGPIAAYGTPLGLLAHIVVEEAQASLLRGALVPVIGLYWGAWGALLIKMLLAWGAPHTPREPGERAFRYLDWGMEAIAAGCFILSHSLWASLMVRTAGHGVVNVLHCILAHKPS